jgi:5-methylcytosine-specific restriction endonuclease McrA
VKALTSTVESWDNSIRVITSKNKSRKKKEEFTDWHKDDIWEKHNGTCERVKCPVCSRREISSDSFSAGHIFPESMGGLMCLENIIPICKGCNSRMGSNHLYWFAWHYYGKILWTSHS